MRDRTPFPHRPANAIALALVTVLALLVAPVCAPLCATKACASGMAQEPCHRMAGMGADGGEQFVAASKVCGAFDFPAVLVKADDTSVFLQRDRNAPASMPITGATAERLGGLHGASRDFGIHHVLLDLSDSLLLTTILRI